MILSAMPHDLLVTIIQLLDPISLISPSQANKGLRSMLNPQKFHFVQRLLALETTPQYGGEYLIYKSRPTGTIIPETVLLDNLGN